MDGDLAHHLSIEVPNKSRPTRATHLDDVFRTRRRVTPEMQAAGAQALAQRYTGVSIGLAEKPKVLTSESAMGIAAAHAYLAMEQVNQQGDRDYLQHPGLFGSDDLLIWQGMTPQQRAGFIQEQSPEYLLGAVGMIRGFRNGIQNPVQNSALGMLCDSLTALARELQRAAGLQRRIATERLERATLQKEAEASEADEWRQRENRARSERRARAKERAAQQEPAEQVLA